MTHSTGQSSMVWSSESIGIMALSHKGNSGEASRVGKSVTNSEQIQEEGTQETLTDLLSNTAMRRENTHREEAEAGEAMRAGEAMKAGEATRAGEAIKAGVAMKAGEAMIQ